MSACRLQFYVTVRHLVRIYDYITSQSVRLQWYYCTSRLADNQSAAVSKRLSVRYVKKTLADIKYPVFSSCMKITEFSCVTENRRVLMKQVQLLYFTTGMPDRTCYGW